jgi:hypothetical protein
MLFLSDYEKQRSTIIWPCILNTANFQILGRKCQDIYMPEESLTTEEALYAFGGKFSFVCVYERKAPHVQYQNFGTV